MFYDPARFVRAGAPPGRLAKTLFSRGAVRSLDGKAHRQRKRMFLALMTPARIARLADQAWAEHARRWESAGRVVLYDEARLVLTRAVCTWAGVPVAEDELPRRARRLTALFESAEAVGPKHWWGRVERKRADRWAAGVIGRPASGGRSPNLPGFRTGSETRAHRRSPKPAPPSLRASGSAGPGR